MVTKDQIILGSFSSDGSPWIFVSTKSSINLNTLEFSFDGSPWYGISTPVVSGGSTFKPILMWFA
jgi:hypothetical protein